MKLQSPNNYQEYVNSQRERSRKTAGRTWVTKQSVMMIGDVIGKAGFGICHGSRGGFEVDLLREITGAKVIGTDICEQENEHVIEWDFHNVNQNWIGKADFIYSNSLDHSYAPCFALSQWVSCLKPHGLLFIEWSPDHDGEPTDADCFRASLEEYKDMIRSAIQLWRTMVIQDRRILVGVNR